MRRILLIALLALTLPLGARADYLDAVELINRGDYAAAYALLLPLAEAGDANAQFHLAFMYDYGQGVEQDDAQAAAWYRRAAEQDLAVAQFTLAGMYDIGKGVEKDPREAYRWYWEAARNLAPSEVRDSILARLAEIEAELPAEARAGLESETQEVVAPQATGDPESSEPAPPVAETEPVVPEEAPAFGDALAGLSDALSDDQMMPAAPLPEAPRWYLLASRPDRGLAETRVAPVAQPAAGPLPEAPPLDRLPQPEAASPDPAQEEEVAPLAKAEPEPAPEPPEEDPPAPLRTLDPTAVENLEILTEWQSQLEEIVSHVTTPSAAIHGWAKVDAWEAAVRPGLRSRLGPEALTRLEGLSRDNTILGDPYGNFQRITQAYLGYLVALQAEIAGSVAER